MVTLVAIEADERLCTPSFQKPVLGSSICSEGSIAGPLGACVASSTPSRLRRGPPLPDDGHVADDVALG